MYPSFYLPAFLFLAFIFAHTPSVLAGCPDGVRAVCRQEGKIGEKECYHGHWGPCDLADSPTDKVVNAKVKPKYYVLTVIYAPPGKTDAGLVSVGLSNVEYKQSSSIGTLTSVSKSFKDEFSYELSVESNVVFSSSTFTVNSGYSERESDYGKLEIKKTETTSIKQTAPAQDGIDHNRDQIWILLNPEINITFVNGRTISWTMSHSGDRAEIQYLYVGWLKNPDLIPQGLAAKLNELGFTKKDFDEMLKLDPFADGNTVINTNRFLPTGTTFPYIPAYAEKETGPTVTFEQTNSDVATRGHAVEESYNVGFSLEVSAGFLDLVSMKFSSNKNWTWTSSSDTAQSVGNVQSATVTVASPSRSYAGPTNIDVYYDSLYRSFLFAPHDPTIGIVARGRVRDRLGRPIPNRAVYLLTKEDKYRTYTNTQGEYKFILKQQNGSLFVQLGERGPKKPVTLFESIDFISK